MRHPGTGAASGPRALLVCRLVCVLACLTTTSAAIAAEGDAPPPCVLFILADDLGYGDLSCQGATDLRTPHIDALAAAGLRWRHAYANSCVCSPTRAAILSGRHPELVGVPGVIRTHPENSWGHLSPRATLLPALLRPRGYHSAVVGKWHLGLEAPCRPRDRGFDEFHGFLGDMMDDYYSHRRHGINYMRRNESSIDPEGHATDLFARWASEYLRRRAGSEAPFLLYLAFNAPHTPIQPPPEWVAAVQAREPGIQPRRARLVALIEHLDDAIGRVLETLESVGLARRTLVVFTSDNGGQLSVGANNGALRDGKGSMYEGGLRVPAIVRWPGRVAPGQTTDRTAMAMDWFATILDAAGAPLPPETDGVSLLPVLRDPSAALPPRTLFFVRREGGARFGGLEIRAVRRGDWKLVRNSPWTPLELFHLGEDPLETTDRARDRRAELRDLAGALRRHLQRGGAVPWQPPERVDPAR